MNQINVMSWPAFVVFCCIIYWLSLIINRYYWYLKYKKKKREISDSATQKANLTAIRIQSEFQRIYDKKHKTSPQELRSRLFTRLMDTNIDFEIKGFEPSEIHTICDVIADVIVEVQVADITIDAKKDS